MRSIQELREEAINSREFENIQRVLIEELEAQIINAIQKGLDRAVMSFGFADFDSSSFNREETTKIVIYQLVQKLKAKNYRITLDRHEKYFLTVMLDDNSGKKAIQELDNYLDQFSSRQK